MRKDNMKNTGNVAVASSVGFQLKEIMNMYINKSVHNVTQTTLDLQEAVFAFAASRNLQDCLFM